MLPILERNIKSVLPYRPIARLRIKSARERPPDANVPRLLVVVDQPVRSDVVPRRSRPGLHGRVPREHYYAAEPPRDLDDALVPVGLDREELGAALPRVEQLRRGTEVLSQTFFERKVSPPE